MLEGRDFKILTEEAVPEEGQLAPVLILVGKYKGVKFKYGTVEVNKHPVKDALVRLKFQFVVLDKNEMEGEIDKEKEFVKTAGDILNNIILSRYNDGQFVKVGEYNVDR